jgi:hypothetical protein
VPHNADEEIYNMYTIVIYPGGRQVEALLLSATSERLRMVIPGSKDTVEFQRTDGKWTSEKGDRVELGALLTDDSVATVDRLSNGGPRTMTAG